MSTSSSLKRPIKIDAFKVAIRDMSSDELFNIQREIENSVHHLERSNDKLAKYIAKLEGNHHHEEEDEDTSEVETIDESDLQLFKDSMNENNIVLKNYSQRLEALTQEHIFRTSGKATNENIKSKNIDSDNNTQQNATPNQIYL
ncbi:Tma17p NDAI_0B03390 [Naumovozyma dairenensis CBS 421]|uniref:Translation machinery-associated protein 17 n=1 Tax=Naumovozyma dairenensis (strain ATCC 10597 / BCRC 20456 / CBS 421 / NBRC 0211 / NRRL Y-12639) TaxID=1071378 RepID=G0W6G2_NAUDC|nr:hypothetical protein NDAI_0B03390 [Naumovozyma dairenensis CBS 421]CCD23373.1 hypothetical protein NDAI_0B03390 [Naumovozyma dairenensis CBS 421]